MPNNIHIFTVPKRDPTKPIRANGLIYPAMRPCQIARCWWCGRRRQARNLWVQIYYDGSRYYCRKPRKKEARRANKN